VKKFIIQLVILLVVIFTALGLWTNRITSIPLIPETVSTKDLAINGQVLKVEVADTQNKRSKGLGGREAIATDSGMLFIFDTEKVYSFWMKGLKFPLDIIWIKDNVIVDIIENVPPPLEGQTDSNLPIYQPSVVVDSVLEVNAGIVDKLNIKVGDKINLN